MLYILWVLGFRHAAGLPGANDQDLPAAQPQQSAARQASEFYPSLTKSMQRVHMNQDLQGPSRVKML